MSYRLAGDLVKKMDPYFPFEKAVTRYAQSFANLGIEYKDATLNLDLLDREKKYSNGFCHWPQPAWVKKTVTESGEVAKKEWVPSVANFTSLAIPSSCGSGKVALTTLMHEAGHAAHFANIEMESPLFSQERAPTSVAYAENQSMFLDSLVDDADWKAKYARDRDGKVVPFELIEESIQQTHPFAIFGLRNMLVVPFFEKALYEADAKKEKEGEQGDASLLSAAEVLDLANSIETHICGGPMGRPVMSVPHILSDESSCYYHGYILADMSVHQTRAYFLQKHGFLTDNVEIGPEITNAYWKCGNSRMFLDLVKDLTGKDLTADAWVAEIDESVESKIQGARKKYDRMLKQLAEKTAEDKPLTNLKMRVCMVHGDEVIADSKELGTIEAAAEVYEKYVRKNFYADAANSSL
eukprot:TRINITY_DN50848_c0_g1_i1.p1 TRINITY_DN50848_c0_g1~~TRINITY_DN50848_c0_g1_i1.p1  ORF type:complete len:410 (+),score=66.73 TRINITY_DN50848_c0_g1_i1:962-2191(+)